MESYESITFAHVDRVTGGKGEPQQRQYGGPGSSGNPEGRGTTLYRNGSNAQTGRDAAHLLEQMGRATIPFNWGSMASETAEGYRRGGMGGAFVSLLGVEH